MNLNEYKQKRELYVQFAKKVKEILEVTILSSGGKYKYHKQQIQCRAKTHESLKKKLSKDGHKDPANIEEIRKDLAGCRVIFYYNDDVNAFLESGLVGDNFKIHWKESNVHGSIDEAETANDSYPGLHYIVELKDNRTSLPEYKCFKGLKCEIQVITTLNHAWAETAHDITYKKPETPGFGEDSMKAMDNRLLKIMKDYLMPAGYEFQKVQHDYLRFLEGKKLFGRNLKQEIIDCQNNNDRYEKLEKYREYTLPRYDHDYLKGEFNTIMDAVRTAVSSARDVKPVEFRTPFDSFPGKAFMDVLNISLSILNFIQYENVELVFSCFVEFYLSAQDKKEKNLIEKSAIKLAKYDIDVLRKAGFFVQDIILMHLEKLNITTLTQIKDLVAVVGNIILDPSVESTSSNYNSVTFKTNILPGNDLIANIRKRAIALLIKIYNSQDPDSEKRHIMAAFSTATRIHSMGNYSGELHALILGDTTEIIDFYISIIPSENYEILESIEERVCFLYLRAVDIIEKNRVGDALFLKHCNALIQSAIKFRDELNSNKEFVIYKTLIGYESVFDESWDNSEWDIHSKDKYREDNIEEYVNCISDDNKNYWEEMIIRCSKTQSKDLATFPHFGKFLNLLSNKQPDFIFDLFINHEEILLNFSCSILDGLLKSSAHKKTLSQMNTWVDEGKHLEHCARVFENYYPPDESIIKKILSKAKEKNDVSALIKVMAIAAKNYSQEKLHLIKVLFLPGLQELTKLRNAGWVFYFWYRPECNKILSALDNQEIDIVLENLVFLKTIDSHTEEILIPIAEKHPKKVLEFFRTRLTVENEDGKQASTFDSIPFNFHRLSEPLSASPELVVNTVCDWYEGDYTSFIFGGARLVSNIFISLTDKLEHKLIALVNTGEEKNLRIVMAILRNYNGNPAINNLCKEIVKTLPEHNNLLSEVTLIMESTGVWQGEFGLVNILKQKKLDISSWLENTDEKIQSFAIEYISELDKRILLEKRRAEESIALRKHQFGDNNSTDNGKDT